MGLRKGSTILYPEALVLDSLVYHDVRENLAGLDVSPEELALDVIDEVGPRGHYLKLKHTRRNMRKIGYPEVTAQPKPDGGFRDPFEVAREKTDWILENHHPEPLDEAQQAEFGRILRAAEGELG